MRTPTRNHENTSENIYEKPGKTHENTYENTYENAYENAYENTYQTVTRISGVYAHAFHTPQTLSVQHSRAYDVCMHQRA